MDQENCNRKKNAWLTLLSNEIPNIQQNLTMFGSLWIHNMTKKITNKFWTNVFEAWLKVLDKLKHGPYYNPDLSPIWYNPCISRDKIFLKQWFDKGIVFVADLLDENGNFQSVENLQNTYNLTINFLDYLSLKFTINKLLSKESPSEVTKTTTRPYIPDVTRLLLKNKKGSKMFYNILNNPKCDLKFKQKWNKEINIEINDQTWKQIFRCCFKTIPHPDTVWFQYKIVNRILGVNKLRNQIDNKIPSKCRVCANEIESIIHLLVNCTDVVALWNDIKKLINLKLRINIKFTPFDILFGYLYFDTNQKPVNTIILVVKRYIFSCAYTNRKLSLNIAMNYLKRAYNDLEYLANVNNKNLEFNKIWCRWKPFFCEV